MSEQALPTPEEPRVPKALPVLLALFVIFLAYVGLLYKGIPQKWTETANGGHHAAAEAEVTEAEQTETPAVAEETTEAEETVPAEETTETEEAVTIEETTETEEAVTVEELAETEEIAEAAEEGEEANVEMPAFWTAIPFCVLLLCIAILPLIPATEHFWESNLNRFLVAAGLGLIVLAYYAFLHPSAVELHWPAHSIVDSSPWAKGGAIFTNAIIGEYIAFIVLLFSLFTITGGIRISGDLKASPLTNSIILFLGAMMASFIGTTGAAMLLIRLLLDTNKERKYKVHTVVFFIFAVCNCGGCLLPIGDPPLFLGYLKGVKFLWTFNLWPMWLFVNGLLVAVYFLMDSLWYYRKETKEDVAKDNAEKQPLRIRGLFPNLFCLIGVVLGVMLLDPAKAIGGWYPPMFLREIVQLLMVAISLMFGSRAIRVENSFNYGAIIEVAALFFGIFICMQAPLQILNAKGEDITKTVKACGEKIGLNEAQDFFWMSGSLSSVLDNAPTYVVFFETASAAARGEAKADPEVAKEIEASKDVCGVPIRLALLIAVSLGSVMMGSMTYIGNGPNFMVKSIAEESGVKMPSFFGYIGYSVCILFPILLVMTLIFLKA